MLNENGKAALLALVTKEEVFNALRAMKSYKAPGPDAFQLFFFKTYWDIIGDDIWNLVKKAYETSSIDSRIAETLVVLIPKVDQPTRLKQFRPISLCNVTYKLITKIFVNKLRPFLNELVGPLQSSFIHGRGTVNNAIVAQEILHYMHRPKSKVGSIAFKIDLENAYDKIDWDFLHNTLHDFDFLEHIINLVMCCIKSSSLTMLWNGNELRSFTPS